MGSFSTPLSGLMAAQNQLKTVSNNLANMNTNGYKDRNLTFSSIFAQAGSTNGSGDPMQTGSGVAVSSTVSTFTDGNQNPTTISSNMALSGNGFFVTQGASGLPEYTRAGDFTTNNAGFLTTPNGELLLGYAGVNGIVSPSGALQPLQVGTGLTTPAVASTMIGITANLDAGTAATNLVGVPGTNTLTFNFDATGTVATGTDLMINGVAAPAVTPGETVADYAKALSAALVVAGMATISVSSTGNQLTVTSTGATPIAIAPTGKLKQDVGGTAPSSSLSVFDSLGSAHILTVAYTKTDVNVWTYTVTVPSADITGGLGTTTVVGSGVLNFSGSGALTSTSNVVPISIPNLANGATSPLTVTGPFGTVANPTVTQTALASTASAFITDGYASGTLGTFAVRPDGTIEGLFSSGKTLALGQVVVASFANNQGLTSVGNNNYQPTGASGAAVVGLAGTGGRGSITGGSVEQSNVDIAAEFAKLIVAQQAYSANAKSITTFNQVSQATLAMIQ